MPGGRPPIFSQETADKICELLIDGKSLREICRREDMPAAVTVCKWLSEPGREEFAKQYARAREMQADMIFDETLEIADNSKNDWVETNDPENPGYRLNGEHVQRSRLRIDTRKWMAGKLRPKKYGEIHQIEHSGSISGDFKDLTPDERKLAIAALRASLASSSDAEGSGDA